jgi:hypothetical protein
MWGHVISPICALFPTLCTSIILTKHLFKDCTVLHGVSKITKYIIVYGIGMLMQNHAKKWFDNTNSTNAMAAIAIGAMLVFSAAGMKGAFADVVQNDIDSSAGSTVSITEGETTTVGYRIHATAGDTGDTTGRNAQTCNPERAPVTIQLDLPSDVTATPSSLTFSTCEEYKNVDFTSSTTGDYTIKVKDAGPEYNEAPATFTLAVEEDTSSGGGGTGGGGGGTTTDTTPPEITADVQGTLGDNEWYTSDVSVHWNIRDGESTVTSTSGCDDVTISQDTDSTGRTITCEATSTGGTASESVTIKRDATAPTVSLVGGPADGSSYFYGFLPDKPTCTAEDPTPGSGLAGDCTVGDYDKNAAAGSHTVTTTAKDNAGNTAEDANAYTVKKWDLRGFTQPVDMGSTVNTLKGGSTVPVKFEIFADTEFTSTSFNGQAVGTFSAKKVSCSTGAGTDDIEVTATGGTSFRYDSTAGQFIYNWQTPKGAGICYDTTFTDQSGSALTAHFKTK